MKTIPPIAERNRHKEPLVHASCFYGRNAGGVWNDGKQFAMLAVTDVHRSGAQLSNAIDYLNYQDALDCGICLGDIQGSNFAEAEGTWYTERVLKSEKPFMTVIGNHDVGNSTRAAISATSQEAFEEFVRPTAPVMGVETDLPYYVKYFDAYKLVLVCLDNYDAPNVRDENGDFYIDRGTVLYSQKQLDWFTDTLAKIPADYHLMICLHAYPYKMWSLADAWSQKDLLRVNGTSLYGENMVSHDMPSLYGKTALLADIVHAWMTGGVLKTDYAPQQYTDILPTLHIDCDFSARGEGIFTAYLSGHLHWDVISYAEAYPDQHIIALPATALDAWQNYCVDMPRVEGTLSEDAITVVSVCTDYRQIRLVRIGAEPYV